MRFRPLLYSAAIATVLAGGVPRHAFAEKGVVLSPQTGWAVTSVADDGSGAGAYCAMARRFRDNLILTVARNKNGESSFALDFPNGNFDTRQSSSIILDPGAGEQRTYEIRPVSKRAFVIRLGADEAFFSALDKTGILRAEVGGETYNFSLPDMGSGQQQLTQCLSGPAAPQTAADASAPGTSAPPADYRKDLEALQQKIDALHEQNSKLADVLSKEQPAQAAPQADTKEIDRLNERVVAISSENESLRTQLESLRASQGKGDGEQSALQAEIDRLRSENASLTAQVSDARGAGDAQQDLQHRIDSLQQENTRLANLLKNTNDSFDKLSAASERMQKDLADQSGQNSEAATLASRITSLESDNRRLTEDLAAARSAGDVRNNVTARSLDDANNLLKAQVAANEDKAKQLEQVSQQLKLAEAENDYLKEQIGTIGKSQDERMRQQSDSLNAEKQNLQAELDRSKIAQSSLDALQSEKARLEADVQKLTQENARLRADGVASNARVENELSEKITALQKENDDMRAAAAKNVSDAVVAKAELARLQTTVSDLEKQRDNLNAALDVAHGDLDSKVNGELAFLTKENERLKASLEEANGKIAGAGESEAKLASLSAENGKLKTDLAEATLRASDNENKLKSVNDENASLRAAMASQEGKGAEVADLTGKMQSLEADNKRLADALAQAQQGADEAGNAKLAALEAENKSLQQKLADAAQAQEGANKEAQPEITGLQAENQKLAASLEELQAENDKLKAGTPSATLSDNELQQQVENLKLENKVLRENAEKDAAKIAALSKQETPKTDPEAGEKISALEGQVSALKQENAGLGAELEKARAALESRKVAKAQPTPEPVKEAVAPAPQPEKQAAAPKQEPVKETAAAAPVEEKPVPAQKTARKEPKEPARVAPYVAPPQRYAGGAQNEAQALEAELNGQLQEMKESRARPAPVEDKTAALEESAPGPVVKPVAAEPLPAAQGQEQGAVETAAAPEPAPDQAKAVPLTHGETIGDILAQAQIPLDKPVASAAGAGGTSLYQWRSGVMAGMAERRPLKGAGEFDALAQQYLEKAQKDCKGDFAVMLDRTEDLGATRIDSYEAACVGQGVNSGATLVFFSQDGAFTALAHKASAENMEATMDARDRILAAIAKSAG